MRLAMEKIRNKDLFVVTFLFYLEGLCKRATFRNVLAVEFFGCLDKSNL